MGRCADRFVDRRLYPLAVRGGRVIRLEQNVWNNQDTKNHEDEFVDGSPMLTSTENASKLPAVLRELREHLKSVPANDPLMALSAVREALELVVSAKEMALQTQARAVAELDEVAQSYLRSVFKGFLQAVALSSARGSVLRVASQGFYSELSSACRLVLDRGRYAMSSQPQTLAEISTRLVRAETNRLKWDHLVYGPFDDGVWRRAGATLSEAVAEQRHQLPVSLRFGRETSTSTLREMTRAVALHCAGLDQMPPDLIDVIDRLIHYILPALHLSPTLVEGARYSWIAESGSSPRRIVRADIEAGAWYFSAQNADAALNELEDMLNKGVVPGVLDVGPGSRDRIYAALRHLRRYWCDAPVKRRYRRHVMSGSVDGVRGFVALQRALKGVGDGVEQWRLHDASVGGMGVSTLADESAMPRIGDLMAIRPDDTGEWRLGMVRRLERQEAPSAFIGLETFATSPKIVRADDGRAPIEILLCDPMRRGAILRVVAPLNSLRPGVPLFVADAGAIQKLKPLGSNWRGTEFEVRTYLVL